MAVGIAIGAEPGPVQAAWTAHIAQRDATVPSIQAQVDQVPADHPRKVALLDLLHSWQRDTALLKSAGDRLLGGTAAPLSDADTRTLSAFFRHFRGSSGKVLVRAVVEKAESLHNDPDTAVAQYLYGVSDPEKLSYAQQDLVADIYRIADFMSMRRTEASDAVYAAAPVRSRQQEYRDAVQAVAACGGNVPCRERVLSQALDASLEADTLLVRTCRHRPVSENCRIRMSDSIWFAALESRPFAQPRDLRMSRQSYNDAQRALLRVVRASNSTVVHYLLGIDDGYKYFPTVFDRKFAFAAIADNLEARDMPFAWVRVAAETCQKLASVTSCGGMCRSAYHWIEAAGNGILRDAWPVLQLVERTEGEWNPATARELDTDLLHKEQSYVQSFYDNVSDYDYMWLKAGAAMNGTIIDMRDLQQRYAEGERLLAKVRSEMTARRPQQ